MLLSLGHVTVRSTDFDRTAQFYCGLLGMHPGPRPAIAVPGRWFYVGDEAVLHVLPARPGAWTSGDPVVDHFALWADDRHAFEQRIRAAGRPFESRRLADSDTWQVFVVDPDGARVELSFREPMHPVSV